MDDRTNAEPAIADRNETDRIPADHIPADGSAADRSSADGSPADRSAADHTSADRTSADRTSTDRMEEFLDTFQEFMRETLSRGLVGAAKLTPLGETVEAFFGQPILHLPVVTHPLSAHRLVDADVALAAMAANNAGRGGAAGNGAAGSGAAGAGATGGPATPIGISGGGMRDNSSLPELLTSPNSKFSPGPVDYISVAAGPDTTRQVMSVGMYLLRLDGVPVAALQRAARPERGRNDATLEILTTEPATATAFLAEFTRLMLALSVLRGQVVSFTGNEFGQRAAGATFLPRPTVDASEVILPPGILEQIVQHVVGIGEHRQALRDAHQHLKRGVLLYGPPGTGKTLTVRHLLSRTQGTTAVLLTGSSIRYITEAAELARAMQPAIVVIEDIDLIAAERGMHGAPQPLLFAVLDALDGLDGDADVTFILTTNRVDILEPALAERPGRVDLAVEIPLPDTDARRRLFAHYAHGLGLSPAAITAAADRATGTTGSFAKELMRRTVLSAAESGRAIGDSDLDVALDSLLDARSQLTRSLLGGG
jgi:hypothetical protein